MPHSIRRTQQAIKDLQQETPIGLHASALSLHVLFSLFPILLLLLTLFSWNASQVPSFLSFANLLIPETITNLLTPVLHRLTEQTGFGTLSLGLLVFLWSTSRTARGLIDSLNRIYNLPSQKGWIRRSGVGVLLTLLFLLLFLLASNVLIWGTTALRFAETHNLIPALPTPIFFLFGWIGVLLGALFLFLLAYHALPNHKRPIGFFSHLPGAIVATLSWVIGSLAFRALIPLGTRFELYGLLGAVMILLLYLQLVSYTFFFGAFLNRIWTDLKHPRWIGRFLEGLTKRAP